MFREAVYNFHSPLLLRGNNWPDNWPIPIKHRGGGAERRGWAPICLPYWTKLLHLWQLLLFNKISGVSRADKSLLISILYMNLNLFQFTRTSAGAPVCTEGTERWRETEMGDRSSSRGTILPGREGASPAIKTGRAGGGGHRPGRGVKLTAPGEQDGQAEGTAAGTAL